MLQMTKHDISGIQLCLYPAAIKGRGGVAEQNRLESG
jgi:hypothetical protein